MTGLFSNAADMWRLEKTGLHRELSSQTFDDVVILDHPLSFQAKANGLAENQFRLILPAVTAIGIRLRHASREGSALGALLSNTRIICPWVGNNLGKLRIIPHRSWMLECFMAQSCGAQG
jgi:hypothetical protein